MPGRGIRLVRANQARYRIDRNEPVADVSPGEDRTTGRAAP